MGGWKGASEGGREVGVRKEGRKAREGGECTELYFFLVLVLILLSYYCFFHIPSNQVGGDN